MEPSSTSDDRLVEAFLEGDASSFEELVHRYGAKVVGAVEGLVRDHHLAMDIAQEVFVKLCEVLPRYRPQGRLRSMIFGMALNRARDALRVRRRSRLIFWEERERAGRDPQAPDTASRQDERAAIESALARVSSPFREAVYLRDVGGLGYEEVARSMRCTLGTAKSRVHRGRMEFREAYRSLVEDRPDPDRGDRNGTEA